MTQQIKKTVSVIVPIYNVEQYLPECLDSIVNQSYSNLEIILVDDGSTDGSGIVADRYAKADNRIKVIHKKNGGLSSARNAGLDFFTGEYLLFVDSDDYIDRNMISKMLYVAEAYRAELVCCQWYRVYSDHKDVLYDIPSNHIIKDGKILPCLLREKYTNNTSTAKLYKSCLWSNNRFPDGLNYEDIITIPVVVKNVNKAVVLKAPMYYYRQREGSITKNANARKYLDFLNAINIAQKNLADVGGYDRTFFLLRKYHLLLRQAVVEKNYVVTGEIARYLFDKKEKFLISRGISLRAKIGAFYWWVRYVLMF